MQDIIMASAIDALRLDVAKLERSSANLANAMTAAYKREFVVQNAASLQAPYAFSSFRDMRPGTLKSTGQALDVALAGPGFFEVATETGMAYTRMGQWQVDSRGRLVTAAGHALMSSVGEIVLAGRQPTIDAQGNLSEAGKLLGRLNIVDFEDAGSLTPLGQGLFAAGIKARTVHEDEVQLLQGFVENSNVSSLQEMVQVTRSMRHFESVLRALQARDEMAGTTLRRLGDF